MPGWTWADVDQRNREILGGPQPAEPLVLPDESPKEAFIELECSRFLEEDGWRGLRTDPVSDRGRGRGFGQKGMADHLFLRPRSAEPGSPQRDPYCCDVIWCEFKAGNRKAKKHQRAWHALERARGFVVWCANETFPATVDGFREHYAKSGLMRRSRWW